MSRLFCRRAVVVLLPWRQFTGSPNHHGFTVDRYCGGSGLHRVRRFLRQGASPLNSRGDRITGVDANPLVHPLFTHPKPNFWTCSR